MRALLAICLRQLANWLAPIPEDQLEGYQFGPPASVKTLDPLAADEIGDLEVRRPRHAAFGDTLDWPEGDEPWAVRGHGGPYL